MHRTNVFFRSVLLYVLLFLGCGLLHVILWDSVFADCTAQLYCGTVVVLWALSVEKRITDIRLRRLLIITAAFLLLFVFLQVLRYRLCRDNHIVRRQLWYCYYIPMTVVPLLCFYVGLSVHRPEDEPLPRLSLLPACVSFLLTAGFLTNHLHFFAFRFPSENEFASDHAQYGWLYIIFCIYFAVMLFLALFITVWKNRTSGKASISFLPALPVLIMALLELLAVFGIKPGIKGVFLWNIGETFIFGILGFLEGCIQIGLIPACRDYEKLFSMTDLPAVILNGRGDPVYQTAGARYPFPENPGIKIRTHAIRGGSISWISDVSQVQVLNEELSETVRQIKTRNNYLAEENKVRQERAELEARSRLYDSISRIAEPQLAQIRELTQNAGADSQKSLAAAAVLCAYVKRRSNMELLSPDGLQLDELKAAIAESLENIRLCGADTALQTVGNGSYPAAMLIYAYEQFEALVESCLDTLSSLLVVLLTEKNHLILRMLLQADAIHYEARPGLTSPEFDRKMSVNTDNRDTIVTLTLTRGGGAP